MVQFYYMKCARAGSADDIGQVELLRQMECDDIQGFYYARPQPCEKFIELVQENE